MVTYVIEHMESDESDGSFPPWVSLEYTQMLQLAAPSTVIFSSLSPNSVESLRELLIKKGAKGDEFETEGKSVRVLMEERGIDLSRCCLLDPKAEKVIDVEDGKLFDWFLFGGILGDDPPRDRTAELRKLGFPTRHLGPMQMTTDTALGVTKIVVQDLIPINKINFIDNPTIQFDASGKVDESVEMPFRYVIDSEGGPKLPQGMKELLRDDMDKSFQDEVGGEDEF